MGRWWGGWVGLCVHPYYAMHALTFISYPLLRMFVVRFPSPADGALLIKWELQAVLSLSIVLMIKYAKLISLEAFLADALLYGKGMLALLAFMLDPRILAWYLVNFAVLFLLFLQPFYSGPENISYLTPLQLENELLNGSQLWLVEFGAACSTRCIQSTGLFADLSLRYSKANLQFARVDLGRFPHAAAKYGITFGGIK
ncbi:hypothetical protein O6H91_06G011200 [Diphasiastrum complanatum]|uniref:Uncharacterized protein n=1 Tax=Diphasiastrum complanatum TaxID=34168 RepID=A0ACC2DAJ6_DIPCM|nr:hypothetical protein O6H91_06G011200 [Diphasiastrum complanatum]